LWREVATRGVDYEVLPPLGRTRTQGSAGGESWDAEVVRRRYVNTTQVSRSRTAGDEVGVGVFSEWLASTSDRFHTDTGALTVTVTVRL
jgi:hypothetical protein